jgi:hypothetical protein
MRMNPMSIRATSFRWRLDNGPRPACQINFVRYLSRRGKGLSPIGSAKSCLTVAPKKTRSRLIVASVVDINAQATEIKSGTRKRSRVATEKRGYKIEPVKGLFLIQGGKR